MYAAAAVAAVGPMAAVAGAVAQHVGQSLLEHSPQVVVENGGDIFLHTRTPRTVALWAGESPLSDRVALRIPGDSELGICTSSGTVGHSHSLGKADAATVVADDAALADAVATALGNRVRCAEDAQEAVRWALDMSGVRGAVVICGAQLSAGGDIELEPLAEREQPD
jgi:ApbE superfamily uncharacterized protein (UPF0280 family)